MKKALLAKGFVFVHISGFLEVILNSSIMIFLSNEQVGDDTLCSILHKCQGSIRFISSEPFSSRKKRNHLVHTPPHWLFHLLPRNCKTFNHSHSHYHQHWNILPYYLACVYNNVFKVCCFESFLFKRTIYIYTIYISRILFVKFNAILLL